MKPNHQTDNSFNESFVSKKSDPLAAPSFCDFDWQALYKQFGEADDSDDSRQKLGQALNAIFRFILQVEAGKPISERQIARRFVAFAWTVNPELFGGLSLAKLSKLMRINQRRTLSYITTETRETFKIQNSFQSHGWKRKPAPRTHASHNAPDDCRTSVHPKTAPDAPTGKPRASTGRKKQGKESF